MELVSCCRVLACTVVTHYVVIILSQGSNFCLNVFTAFNRNTLNGFNVPYLNLGLQCFGDVVCGIGITDSRNVG